MTMMIIQGILLLNQTTEESVKKNSGGGLGIKQNKIPTISKALTGRPKPGGGAIFWAQSLVVLYIWTNYFLEIKKCTLSIAYGKRVGSPIPSGGSLGAIIYERHTCAIWS